MKKILPFLFFVLANLTVQAQCSNVGVQISSSDTTLIQLYNAGFFLIPSGIDNVVEWEVTSFSGEIIHQETTSGDFNDQSSSLFNHTIPITDSMKATIVITNTTAGIICTMNDTLYWKETEVLPGSFIGNWDVLSSNGGEEEQITATTEFSLNAKDIEIFPSPVYNNFTIKSDLAIASIKIFNLNGQVLSTHNNIRTQDQVDISNCSAGIYFVQFWDENGKMLATKKVVKM